MSDISNNERLVVVVDHGGRQFVGKLEERTSEVVVLRDYLKYNEQALPVHDGPAQVQLQFAPPSHMFKIDNITVKWLSINEVDDPEMISAYEKYWTQIRAARSGLSIASNVPKKQDGQLQV